MGYANVIEIGENSPCGRRERVLKLVRVALDAVSAPHIHRPYFFVPRLWWFDAE